MVSPPAFANVTRWPRPYTFSAPAQALRRAGPAKRASPRALWPQPSATSATARGLSLIHISEPTRLALI
eukprot:8543948-Alexandrium_andersonii.AAC.1